MTDPRSEYGQAYDELLSAVKNGVFSDMSAIERDDHARAVIRRYTTALAARVTRDLTGRTQRAARG